MASLSPTAFVSKWFTNFADNTTGQITEQKIRDFAQDIADSFLNAAEETRTELTTATLDYSVKFQYRNTAGTVNITAISNAKRDAKGVMVRLAAGTEITFAAGLNVEILALQDTTKPSYLVLQCIDKTAPAYVASFGVVNVPATQPSGNVTPAVPTLTADDIADTLAASHALGDSEILVSENDGAYTAYAGVINVGDVARAQGYWKFKIKAATGRNESATAESPAFTVAGGAPAITPAAPTNPVNDDMDNTFTFTLANQ